jgi:hypothetical protein
MAIMTFRRYICSQGGVYEGYSLKRDAVWFGRNVLTFRRDAYLLYLLFDTEDGDKKLRNGNKVSLYYMAFISQNIVLFMVVQDFIQTKAKTSVGRCLRLGQ